MAPDHKDFESSGCLASNPTPTATPTKPYRAKCEWNIHRKEDDIKVSAGAGVYDTAGLCPPFLSSNSNAFGSTFGIEFTTDSTCFIGLVSAYEVACSFRLSGDLTHALSHPANFCLLDYGVPSTTSGVLFDAMLKRLECIRTWNFDIHHPSRYAAPAAIAQVPAFTNGAVGSRIPH